MRRRLGAEQLHNHAAREHGDGGAATRAHGRPALLRQCRCGCVRGDDAARVLGGEVGGACGKARDTVKVAAPAARALRRVVGAEDVVGKVPRVAAARDGHSAAVEPILACPLQHGAQDGNVGIAVGDASRMLVPRCPRWQLRKRREHRVEARDPAREGPHGACIDHAATTLPDSPGHESRRLRGVAQGQDCAEASFVERHLLGVRLAKRREVDARALVGRGQLGGDGGGGSLLHDGGKAPDGVVTTIHEGHLRDLVAAETEHAKVHLRPALVVAHLPLEEGHAQEEVVRPRQVQHLGDAEPELGPRVRAVELPDVDGRRREHALICVQEERPDVPGRVGGVVAVGEALLVKDRQVVARHIANRLRVLHGTM
mmetsp:Transcript_70773/g.182502  ORF Transcript_70773/g.182502 Transcript_70773/m.182502 type:complete len:371 (+) Transcript_70773:749-1861(+)